MSENKKKGTLVHDALILFAITLIAAMALGAVYGITKEPIEKAKAEAKTAAYREVFPEMVSTLDYEEGGDSGKFAAAENILSMNRSEYDGITLDEVLMALDAQGNPIGNVLTVTSSKGYGGNITAAVGVDANGVLKGVRFLSISETAGLGMKAKDEEFLSQFTNVKVGSFSLAKRNIEGEKEIDAISSATITTAAVTRIVNAAVKLSNQIYGIGAKGGAGV